MLYSEDTIRKTICTYKYNLAELKSRYIGFAISFGKDMIEEAESLLEDGDRDAAMNILNSIPVTPFESLSLAEMKDGFLFPVLFSEVVEDHYKKFPETGRSVAEKEWLETTQIIILNDRGGVKTRFPVSEGDW